MQGTTLEHTSAINSTISEDYEPTSWRKRSFNSPHQVFEVVSTFAAGRLQGEHWTGQIESVVL